MRSQSEQNLPTHPTIPIPYLSGMLDAGKLSRDEWVTKFGNDKLFDACLPLPPSPTGLLTLRSARYDLDGDGVISPEEWLLGESARAAYESLDRDGEISTLCHVHLDTKEPLGTA